MAPRVNVRALRTSMGLSVEKLADKLGVHWTTVSRWENARADPSPLALGRLRELTQPPPEAPAPSRRAYAPSTPSTEDGLPE